MQRTRKFMKFKIFVAILIASCFGSILQSASVLESSGLTEDKITKYQGNWKKKQTERKQWQEWQERTKNDATPSAFSFDINLEEEAYVRNFRQEVIGFDFPQHRKHVESNQEFYKTAFGVSLLYGWLLNQFENIITPFYVGAYFSFNTLFQDLAGNLSNATREIFFKSRFAMGLAAVEEDRFAFLFDGIIPLHYAISQVREKQKAENAVLIQHQTSYETPRELFKLTLTAKEQVAEEIEFSKTGYHMDLLEESKVGEAKVEDIIKDYTIDDCDFDDGQQQFEKLQHSFAKLRSVNALINGGKITQKEEDHRDEICLLMSLPSIEKPKNIEKQKNADDFDDARSSFISEFYNKYIETLVAISNNARSAWEGYKEAERLENAQAADLDDIFQPEPEDFSSENEILRKRSTSVEAAIISSTPSSAIEKKSDAKEAEDKTNADEDSTNKDKDSGGDALAPTATLSAYGSETLRVIENPGNNSEPKDSDKKETDDKTVTAKDSGGVGLAPVAALSTSVADPKPEQLQAPRSYIPFSPLKSWGIGDAVFRRTTDANNTTATATATASVVPEKKLSVKQQIAIREAEAKKAKEREEANKLTKKK